MATLPLAELKEELVAIANGFGFLVMRRWQHAMSTKAVVFIYRRVEALVKGARDSAAGRRVCHHTDHVHFSET